LGLYSNYPIFAILQRSPFGTFFKHRYYYVSNSENKR
jgi:hypothetical protein